MARNVAKILQSDTTVWVEQGIISNEQRQKILDYYDTKDKKMTQRLPTIMIVLASVLISLGIIMWIAANWEGMPKEAKLAQIFAIIMGLYASAYYFLCERNDSPTLGRGLLLVAVFSFGAGIGLISQIYNITSHPTHGILVWALASIAMAWVTKQYWSLYLGAVLVGIWNTWETFEFYNYNPFFFVMLALLVIAFKVVEHRQGILAVVLLGILYFYEFNICQLNTFQQNFQEFHAHAFLFLQVPFGLMLVAISRRLENHDFWGLGAKCMGICGWIVFSLAFVIYGFQKDYRGGVDFSYIAFLQHTFTLFLPLQFLAFLLVARLVQKSTENVRSLFFGFVVAIILFLIPMNTTFFHIFSSLGLLCVVGCLPYFSIRDSVERYWEHIALGFFLLLLVIVQFIVALAVSLDRYGNIPRGLGMYVFLLVFYAISSYVVRAITPPNRYPTSKILKLSAGLGFLSLYILSFFDNTHSNHIDTISYLHHLILVTCSIGIFVYAYRELKGILVGLVVFLGVLTITMGVLIPIHLTAQLLLINLLMFGLEAMVIYQGTCVGSFALVNWGIGIFVLHVLTRYFHLSWDLLSGGALFIVTGVVVMAGGYLLEKSRKKILQKMREDQSKKGA